MMHLFRLIICFGLLIEALVGLPSHTVWADNSRPSTVFLPILVNLGNLSSQSQDPVTLQSFILSVDHGEPTIIVGVFALGALAQPVVQQPVGTYNYISKSMQAVTQFSLVQAPVTGLIAHNSLAGIKFFKMVVDQEIYLVMGDGSNRGYRVSQIDRYQAVNPNDPTSEFINEKTGQVLSAAQLFTEYYLGQDHVTFQTCILKDDNPSWGRLFEVAIPVG